MRLISIPEAAERLGVPATIRRELNVLGAALKFCAREGYLTSAPPVTMPPAPETRQRALTRDEVAALIRSARRLGHARRWARLGHTWAVEWRGARIADTNTGWDRVVAGAGLDWRPTPHTLKHTAITWAIQGGASIPDAAGFFATSVETIERVYWHLSPDFQRGAVSAIERGAR